MVTSDICGKSLSAEGSLATGEGLPSSSPSGLPLRAQPLSCPACSRQADALVTKQLRHGERDYKRLRDLPGLLHLFPAEIMRLERAAQGGILQKLELALRAERRRGRQGHWRYSLARHIALAQACSAERCAASHALSKAAEKSDEQKKRRP